MLPFAQCLKGAATNIVPTYTVFCYILEGRI